MATISLGNVAPISKLTIPETGERVVVPEAHLDQSTTIIQIPPDFAFDEALTTITKQLWPHMSAAPPAWVDGDDPELVAAVAASFKCPQGEPEGWEIVVNDNPRPQYAAPLEAAQAALGAGIGHLEAPPAEPEPAVTDTEIED